MLWTQDLYSSHTNANDVELETAFEQFAFNLACDAIKTNMTLGHHRTLLGSHCSCHGQLSRAKALSVLRTKSRLKKF